MSLDITNLFGTNEALKLGRKKFNQLFGDLGVSMVSLPDLFEMDPFAKDTGIMRDNFRETFAVSTAVQYLSGAYPNVKVMHYFGSKHIPVQEKTVELPEEINRMKDVWGYKREELFLPFLQVLFNTHNDLETIEFKLRELVGLDENAYFSFPSLTKEQRERNPDLIVPLAIQINRNLANLHKRNAHAPKEDGYIFLHLAEKPEYRTRPLLTEPAGIFNGNS